MNIPSLFTLSDSRTDSAGRGADSEAPSAPLIRTVPSAITPISPRDILAGVHGQYSNSGRKEFRIQILRYLDGNSAGTYTSFRRALAACLQTLRAESTASTVLVPSFCSSDYPKVTDGIGLDLRRYDVHPETLAADIDSLRSQSFDDVLAVIAVNVLGYTSEMETLETLCDAHDVFLVEALGYGIGAEYRGRRLGTFGDCSVLNFQQGKPLPIGGGMVVSQHPKLTFDDAGRPAISPNIGTLSGYMLFSHPEMYGLYRNGGEKIATVVTGTERPSTHPESKEAVTYAPLFKTMSDFQGAVGCRVLDRLSAHRSERAQTAQWYTEQLAEHGVVTLLSPVADMNNHPYVRYPLLVDSQERRKQLYDRLAAAGIQSSILYDWPPIDADRYPGGAMLQDRLLTIPTHPYVSEADRSRVVECITQLDNGVTE